MPSKSESKNCKDCDEMLFVGGAVEKADVTMAFCFAEVEG